MVELYNPTFYKIQENNDLSKLYTLRFCSQRSTTFKVSLTGF